MSPAASPAAPRGAPHLGCRRIRVSKLRVGHGGRGPEPAGGAGWVLRAGPRAAPPLLGSRRLLGAGRAKPESRSARPRATRTFQSAKESGPRRPRTSLQPHGAEGGSGTDRPHSGDTNTYFAKKKKKRRVARTRQVSCAAVSSGALTSAARNRPGCGARVTRPGRGAGTDGRLGHQRTAPVRAPTRGVLLRHRGRQPPLISN